MPWLLRGGEVLATVEVADTLPSRVRGLLGRDGLDGALLLRPARSVHTLGMRFPIDVAYLDADLVVQGVATMRPHRLGLPRVRCACVVEARAGAFERWRLVPGDHLELKG
ncbi:MAG: DUF192 domain-containing protein [Acidimicrobiales bacterium]